MHRSLRLSLVTCATLFAAACGGTDDTTAGGGGSGGSGGSGGAGGAAAGPPVLEIVYGAPTPPSGAPDTKQYPLQGYATAVGQNGPLVAIGTTVLMYEAAAQGITPLDIVGDEPDLPLETGHVRAVFPHQDGLLAAADNALFYTTGGVLQLSMGSAELHPLGITAATSRVADDDGDGADELHLTLIAKDAAYDLSGTTLVKWTVDGESGPPTAAFGQRDRLYLAFGRDVYEVDRTAGKAYPLIFDIGTVTAIACDSLACEPGSLIYFATDRGLIERGSDGNYTLYPLAAEGEPAVPAETFAYDAGRQRLYALAGDSVVRVRAGAVPDGVAASQRTEFPRSMAFDKLGDLWIGNGPEARSIALGTPLSFAADVKPIMHEYCAPCHTGPAGKDYGSPVIDFEDYDKMVEFTTKVLSRIADGSMPPLASGYPAVPKDKIQLIQDWAVTKAK